MFCCVSVCVLCYVCSYGKQKQKQKKNKKKRVDDTLDFQGLRPLSLYCLTGVLLVFFVFPNAVS